MATGTPVISTDIGNVKELIGDSGIIVKDYDVETFYRALEKSIEINYNKLQKKAIELSSNNTWEMVSKRLDTIYTSFLKERGSYEE